jgi:hypothetical protein
MTRGLSIFEAARRVETEKNTDAFITDQQCDHRYPNIPGLKYEPPKNKCDEYSEEECEGDA